MKTLLLLLIPATLFAQDAKVAKPPVEAAPAKVEAPKTERVLDRGEKAIFRAIQAEKAAFIQAILKPHQKQLDAFEAEFNEHYISLCKSMSLVDAAGKPKDCSIHPKEPTGRIDDWSQAWLVGKPVEPPKPEPAKVQAKK